MFNFIICRHVWVLLLEPMTKEWLNTYTHTYEETKTQEQKHQKEGKELKRQK